MLKVYPNAERYNVSLVNIYVLGRTEDEKVFDRQVLELKKLMQAFQPREVVIDINGLIASPYIIIQKSSLIAGKLSF